MTTALILTTFNRPEYLRRCLDSLTHITPPDIFIIVDDASTDSETLGLIHGASPLVFIHKQQNKGIKDSLRQGFEMAWHLGATVAISLDADTIVKADFMERLLDAKERYPMDVVCGINSTNYNANGTLRNPIIGEREDVVLKKFANGQNLCINKYDYESYFDLHSVGNWDYNTSIKMQLAGVQCVCIKPSVVQHIGIVSSMGHAVHEAPDVALDFKTLNLPSVTLFGIDANDPQGIKRAAEICLREVDFGATVIITQHNLFRGREAYSDFCIEKMADYIETPHVLIIHPDGYIQNPNAWNDEWLQYDYIGASWWFKDGRNVGNGGFSLRSKKLLGILAGTDLTGINPHPEDEFICRRLRPWLEREHGIKFAPVDVADRFSIEAYNVPSPDNVYSGQFGFHGYHVRGLPIPTQPRAMHVPINKANSSRSNFIKR